MCKSNTRSFSGYAADVWAAGVCLHVFATGKLPFFSNLPLELFRQISDAEISYEDKKLSADLVALLKLVLEKEPSKRAGIGECLKDPFCCKARHTRIWDLRDELHKSKSTVLVVKPEDIRMVRIRPQ